MQPRARIGQKIVNLLDITTGRKITNFLKNHCPYSWRHFYYSAKLRGSRLAKRDKLKFEVHLADHCNVNCKGCDEFAPLAEPSFTDVNEFARDLNRLSELFHKEAETIYLLGGEPLLNPNVCSFVKAARQAFPSANIYIVTNGLLLPKMPAVFWQTCQQNHARISITVYPIKIDLETIKSLADSYQLSVSYESNTNNEEKQLIKWVMDLEGKQNIQTNFKNCSRANQCITLKRGRLYTCSLAPHICHFNKAFGKDLPLTEQDSIDIYQAKSGGEILSFLCKPIPFCRFCNLTAMKYGMDWERSRKDISEWT